jgi:RimJ/RimL family protein N-acetyltransferase
MTFSLTKLQGQLVDLEPLHESHREALRLIAQDESIWHYFLTPGIGHQFDQWFDKALADMTAGQQLAFAVRCRRTQSLLGSTRLYDFEPKHKRVTIGYTWYVKDSRGTGINPECKQLLLACAFETLQVNRVQIAADLRNLRARAAIKKLGATQEGILRQHMILDNGYVRDTVVFSIVKNEWPEIKKQLQARIVG